jgi:hypothetical protein
MGLYDGAARLNRAAEHAAASNVRKNAIQQNAYVRYSEVVRLIGFDHSKFAPPDSLHSLALGE